MHCIAFQISPNSGEVDGYLHAWIFSGILPHSMYPIDSSEFNCIHGRDTFYNSYYQYRSSADKLFLRCHFR